MFCIFMGHVLRVSVDIFHVEVDIVGECGKVPIYHLGQVLNYLSEGLLHD